MSENTIVIKKNSKIFSKVLLCLIFILLVLGSLNIFRIVTAGFQDNTKFSVKETKDDFDEISYYLTINEKKFYGINLEKVQVSQETNLPNYKASYILNRSIVLINQIIVITMFFVVYKMLREIVHKESAFTISNAKALKIISFLILALVFIAPMIELTINFFIFFSASIGFTISDILLFFVSLAVWGISYIMAYGCELQKEVDETL